ncbi:DUF3027 domain-containing protein [Agrococcus sp. Marseille-P2731]|uniref:DUF3027 domain-containing protein n=1 Tax=Agrococcus sp. Marseille-P2731 TaxID=1841862 RepID=UPI000930AE8D|nr:DUF3027 domain-containing protein [Agrococcus sp. Marseille-P2731]
MTSMPESQHEIPEPEAGEGEVPEPASGPPVTAEPMTAEPETAQSGTAESEAAEHETAETAEIATADREAPVPTTPTMQELELALAALDEIAPSGAVGEVQDALATGGAHGQAQVVAIRHASQLAGYPDWSWTVLLSRGLEGGPTVLEVALLPGETSLLAPAWVPWSERLADYLAAKDAGLEGDDVDDDEELDSDLEADLEDDFDDDFDVEDADTDDDADADRD